MYAIVSRNYSLIEVGDQILFLVGQMLLEQLSRFHLLEVDEKIGMEKWRRNWCSFFCRSRKNKSVEVEKYCSFLVYCSLLSSI